MEVCPTAIVRASTQRVWDLLTDSRELARWSGITLLQGPGRLTEAGQHLVFGVGFGHVLRITFEVLDLKIPRQLRLLIRLPFGVVNREEIQIAQINASVCRVTFN